MNNPLASGPRRPAPRRDDPMMRHAQIWQHMHAQSPDELTDHVEQMDALLPTLAALAGNPKVTAKDVIKAVSAAVADGKMAPSRAVETISTMPADADKLKMWLRQGYAANLTAAVHAKAALMAKQQPQAPPMAAPGVPLNG